MVLTRNQNGKDIPLTPLEIEEYNKNIKEHALREKELAATQYQRERSASYPPISDQLDMIWHAIDQGMPLDKTSAFYQACKSIKEKFPKQNIS